MSHRTKRHSLKAYGLANNSAAVPMLFANADLTIDEHGWTVLPFGLWPHPKGLQKFGNEEAQRIVAAFQGIMGKLKRAITGLPIFKGHPDVPELQHDFPDKTEYGQVADMEVRSDGLAIRQVLSSKGGDLVRAGWKYISPYWDAIPTGEKEGQTLWSPTSINSIGLVKKPNIPNKSLANNAPTMNPELLKLLSLPVTATEAEMLAAVTKLANVSTSLANAETAKTTAEAAAAEATAKLANVSTERDTAVTALANERKERIAHLVTRAVADGRIPAAEKDLYTSRLANSFAVELTALDAKAPAVKVNPTTEQELLAKLNAKLANMTMEERAKLVHSGSLSNDSSDSDGSSDMMANVRKMSALIANEMESPACKNIKSYAAKHAAAYANVLKAHPDFAKMDRAGDGQDPNE